MTYTRITLKMLAASAACLALGAGDALFWGWVFPHHPGWALAAMFGTLIVGAIGAAAIADLRARARSHD